MVLLYFASYFLTCLVLIDALMASTLLRSADGMYPDAEGVTTLLALAEPELSPDKKAYVTSTATTPTISSV